MIIPVICPNCGRPSEVAATDLGKRVKCPVCGSDFEAQAASGAGPNAAQDRLLNRQVEYLDGIRSRLTLVVALGFAILGVLAFGAFGSLAAWAVALIGLGTVAALVFGPPVRRR